MTCVSVLNGNCLELLKTFLVAYDNGRNAILIELNSDYVNLIQERCGLFYKKGLELSHD